ncbi:MAG TPA: DUF5666 domain-containing protein [Thermoanaerobaculia bacterium]|nr:DUF5666 domain-containing protein [Thermoanaerobaculia bacterium]
MSTFAQYSPLVGTVIDVDEGRGRLQIESDDDAKSRITVETDSVSTTYYGFGTVIADKPEIFTGSSGLSNVRLGDRVSINGATRSEGVIKADRVTLLGRTVSAGSVGVGQTRDPATSVATPMDDRATAQTPTGGGAVEGTIRQLNLDDGRIVVQTTNRRMMTVRTYRNTPVVYRGETYRTSNLELGDVIRVDTDPRTTSGDEVVARRIEVTRSVQESGTAPPTGGLVTTLSGRVTRVEASLDAIYVDANRTSVRVDMGQAEDSRGDAIRASDVRVGDSVEVSGSFNRTGDLFLASTVRFAAASDDEPPADDYVQYGLVTITGTVTETLEDASTVSIRDRDSNRVLRLWIANDFVVRTRGNTYTTAEQLRVNDTVVVEAFRDDNGNLIAQTVRLRNR